MAAPARRLAVLVVPGSDAPAAWRAFGPERRKRLAQEHQRGLVDAQELLVALALRAALRPDELAGQLVAEIARHAGDRLLAEEVGPHGERRSGPQVRDGAGQPSLGERAVVADRFESEHGVPVDLAAGVRIAGVASLPAPREQAVGRIGDERIGLLAAQRLGVRLVAA